MTRFEPDGVYNSIPYRVLPDCSIEAMMPGGLVRFKNMAQLVAASANLAANSNPPSTAILDIVGRRNVPAVAGPLDYYSILLEAIRSTKQNSAQLRALVYERARFNLKRDVLFGHSTMGLADVVRQINDFELAVARIEANSIDDPPSAVYRDQRDPRERGPRPAAPARPAESVQILPPKPMPPLYRGLTPQRTESFHFARLAEEFVRHVRFANKFIGIALAGIAVVGIVIIAVLWPFHKTPTPVEIASKASQSGEAAGVTGSAGEAENSSKPALPLPSSFGIYVLSSNKLTELEPLPIAIPDPRIALSAEIDKPSAVTISDDKPVFILFRRDLLNNAPQKIMLRVVAQMSRETKIVGGKAGSTPIEGAWRIRNISRELKISPIAGQREMVMAHIDDDTPLAAGRYALVLNRTGYDFTITGTKKSPEFCLEKLETANGAVFNQCRSP